MLSPFQSLRPVRAAVEECIYPKAVFPTPGGPNISVTLPRRYPPETVRPGSPEGASLLSSCERPVDTARAPWPWSVSRACEADTVGSRSRASSVHATSNACMACCLLTYETLQTTGAAWGRPGWPWRWGDACSPEECSVGQIRGVEKSPVIWRVYYGFNASRNAFSSAMAVNVSSCRVLRLVLS